MTFMQRCTIPVIESKEHVHTFDVYRVMHRSGAYRDVRATCINDARRWANSNFLWKQTDMHVRIVELSNVSNERRHTGLTIWLRNALPFNLWR